MKRLILALLMCLVCVSAQAQCVAEVKDVIQDPARGSIIVQTQYTLNGEVVQQGQTRYLETSGTNEEIIAKVKEDIAQHCETLIRRIESNRTYLQSEKLKRQKELTVPVIDAIKDELIGEKATKTEVTDEFKGKTIKVTYDEKNTISDTISVK